MEADRQRTAAWAYIDLWREEDIRSAPELPTPSFSKAAGV
jgi:hypothetical protein